MSFVQRRARLGDMTPVNGSSYTNPDGSPTYDTLPYNSSDANNPYNYDSIYNDTYNAPYAGPSAAPAIVLPPLFVNPISAYTPPAPVYVPPLQYAPALPPVNVTPAPAPPMATPAVSLASLLGPISSLLNPGASAVTVNKSLVPAAATAAPPATTIAGISTSTLLLVAAGVGAFLLLKKRR
jgi:hypothetical protein